MTDKKEIENHSKKLEELRDQLEDRNKAIEELKSELTSECKKVSDYQEIFTQIDEYKDKIKSQNKEIRRERNRYKKVSEELQQKNEDNERKTAELTEIMHTVDAQKDKLKEQKKTLMRQKRELDRSNKLLAQMNRELSEKNRELTKMSEELYRLAHTDSLTSLYNRRTFIDEIEREFEKSIRYDRVVSCIIFDIDNFKRVNDTYGHLQGDEVLRQIGNIAKDVSRKCDMVARYGGEEFVVLMPETDVNGGLRLAERLRKAVEKHKFPCLDKPNEYIPLTVSIGVSDSREKGINHHEKLLNSADTALYYAKNHGKNMTKIYLHNDEELHESDAIIPFPTKLDEK